MSRRFGRMWRVASWLGTALALGAAASVSATPEAVDDPSAFEAVATRGAPVQPPAAAPLPPRRSRNLVTSRKRAEEVEQIPESIDRLGATDLRGLQIRRLDDASVRVPNLFVGSSMGLSNSARAALRGTGQNDFDAFIDPGVAVYLDGVYLARAQGQLLSLGDVDLVEVIRGPQGTIFGKNALGGAINVVTRKPEFEFGGSAELRVGNFDLFESRVALNVPLVPEKAAARLSVATKTRDGFVKNLVNGADFSDDKLLGGRLQLLLLPSSNVEVLVSADHSIERRMPLGGKCVPAGGGTGLSAIPPAVTGFNAQCARDQARSDFEFESDVLSARDALRTLGSSVQVVWDVAPSLSVTSISSVRQQLNRRSLDSDSTAVNLAQPQLGPGKNTQSQLSQELRLSGRVLDGRLGYVAGVYGFGEKADQRGFDNLGFLPPIEERFRTDNLSYEGFGQLSYRFTDHVDLTVGLRRTEERKQVNRRESRFDIPAALSLPGDSVLQAIMSLPESSLMQLAQVLSLPPDALLAALNDPAQAALLADRASVSAIADSLLPPFSFKRSARFAEWSPSAALSYQFDSGALLYTSYSTGFRSGGFNGRATSVAATNEIRPEDLTSYEVGVKSSAFGGKLALRAAAFYNIGRDVQLGLLSVDNVVGLTELIRRNASKQVMRGGEFSLAWRPLDRLRLGADIGVLRSRYVEFDDNLPDPRIARKQPVISPNYTMNFSAQYEVPLRPGTLGARVNWSHTGSYNNDVQGTRALQTGKHGLLDARISLALPDGKTELAIFGSNLLNRRYVDGGIGFQESFGFATRFFGPPRFYGLEVRRSF